MAHLYMDQAGVQVVDDQNASVETSGFHVVLVETRVSFACLHVLFPQEVGFLYEDVDGDE
jgi:hypothetical protein